jgi:hypothetical protein
MNTTNSKTDPAAAEQFARNFETDFRPADDARTEALQQLTAFRTAKGSHLERLRLRLVDKLGENDPRVQELDGVIASNNVLSHALGAEVDRAKAGGVEPDPEAWMVHGYVRSADGQGQSKLTIVACDQNGRWVRPLGYSCTDCDGYFKLRYPESGGKPDEVPPPDKIPELFLRVSDQEHKILVTDQAPLNLHLGIVDYREIYLPDDAASCTPPPEQEREDFPDKQNAAAPAPKTQKKPSRKKASKKEDA